MAKLVLFNKPFNVLSQFTDGEGRETLANYIRQSGVYPAGRLDRDSEGLLLLTDNGRLQHEIAHPNANKRKTYWVEVEGVIEEPALRALREGVILKDGLTRPAQAATMPPPAQLWHRDPPVIDRLTTSWLKLTITEGKNRQVRRMTAAVGHPTLRLIRYSIGDWSLDNLPTGESKTIELNMPVGPTTPKRPPRKSGPQRARSANAGRGRNARNTKRK